MTSARVNDASADSEGAQLDLRAAAAAAVAGLPMIRWCVLSLSAVVLAACGETQRGARQLVEQAAVPITAPRVGTRFPATSVPLLAGERITLSPDSGQRQSVTLVNVWATWCAPCKAEFPDLQDLHARYGPRGLRVVAVSTDETDAPVQSFLMATGVSFLIGRDTANVLLSRLQESGIPQNVLIGRDGVVLYKAYGLGRPMDPALLTAIEAALADGS